MDIVEKAKLFAMNAHMGQIRKSSPDEPYIIHPLRVSKILKDYGYDENVIAAGLLHDVVEDTPYTIEDIKEEFGLDIASLVLGCTESDKSLSWEARKEETIRKISTMSFRNRAIVCADKIDNIESMMCLFGKIGSNDFSCFNRGEEKQRWYYKSLYESFINNDDINNPMYKRLKNGIDIVFDGRSDEYLKNVVFQDDIDRYKKLISLHAQKEELKKLKTVCKLTKPFVVEFTGTPRSGKTRTINMLYEFFVKGGFDVSLLKEYTTSFAYRNGLKRKISNYSLRDKNVAIVEAVHEQLQNALDVGGDIILADRSLYDRQVWNYLRYLKGDFLESDYLVLREKYGDLSKSMIDYLVMMHTFTPISLQRDYYSSLSLEPRTFLNTENIEDYNEALVGMIDYFKENSDNFQYINTAFKPVDEGAMSVASELLPAIRKRYLKDFKDKYNIR